MSHDNKRVNALKKKKKNTMHRINQLQLTSQIFIHKLKQFIFIFLHIKSGPLKCSINNVTLFVSKHMHFLKGLENLIIKNVKLANIRFYLISVFLMCYKILLLGSCYTLL